MSDKIREALLALARRIEEAEGEPIHIDTCAAHHLRAALARQPATAVPEGWKLVPVDPTLEMLNEIQLLPQFTREALTARYRAMLAAAPPAEQPDTVAVPRELLERLAGSPDLDPDCCVAYYRQQLRALLAGGEA